MKLSRCTLAIDQDANGARHYHTPIGRLPSVTTILRATSDLSNLNAWRNRVGASHAARVSVQARERGVAFHEEMAAYFKGGCPETGGSVYLESVRPFLKRVGDVALVEGAVWHPSGFAGCVDCVAWVDGVPSIIDWKTTSTPKRDQWVTEQHLQVAAYRAAVEARYEVEIQRSFVVFALDEADAQVFETIDPDEEWAEFLERFELFKRL